MIALLSYCALVIASMAAVYFAYIKPYKEDPTEPPMPPKPPLPEPVPPQPTPAPAPSPTEALQWATPKQAWHSVRVLCDRAGLSLAEKNDICAVVYQESGFSITAIHKNAKTTDYGICQFNDGKNAKTGEPYWIGPGALFTSVQDVYANPARAVNTMIGCYKRGEMNIWSSWQDGKGPYKQWLSIDSRMWALAV